MSFNFELGKYYDVYLKSDTNKTIFQAKFYGNNPLIFIDEENNEYKSYDLVYVKPDKTEISL